MAAPRDTAAGRSSEAIYEFSGDVSGYDIHFPEAESICNQSK